MAELKERLRCQHCGNQLEDDQDSYGHRIVCVICGREHDENGQRIPHPVGGRGIERKDGNINDIYGPRLPTQRKIR